MRNLARVQPRWLVFWLLVIGVCSAAQAGAAEPATAVGVVESFQEKLLAVMRDGKKLGFEGRMKELEPAVRDSHDLPRISRIVLGKYWKELTPEQRQRFEKVFTDLSVATYAYNFKEHSGETFTFESEEDAGPGNKVVHMIFTDSEGGKVRFDYMMKKNGDRWLIINIIADGVSDLALKRTDYDGVLASKGFDHLLEMLKSKIDSYSKKET